MAGIPGGCAKAEITFDNGTTWLDLGAPKKQGTSISAKAVTEDMASGGKRHQGIMYDFSVSVPDLIAGTVTAITTGIANGTKAKFRFTTFTAVTITTVAMAISYTDEPQMSDPAGASRTHMITGSAFGVAPSDVLTYV